MSKQPHSSFWLKRFDWDAFRHMDKTSPAYLLALSSIRRGVENFVRIVSEKEIPVKYVTSDKVTVNETIMEANNAKIEIAAPDDLDKIDSIVGRAIAEGIHLVLSHQTDTEESIPLFEAVRFVLSSPEPFITSDMIDDMTRLQIPPEVFGEDLARVMLVIEDRRCDAWMYTRAPGYRPYYDEMYSEIWMSPEVTDFLASDESTHPTLQNYRFRTTNLVNPNNDYSALPGLDDIARTIDIAHVERFATDVKKWHTFKQNYGIDATTGRKIFVDQFLPDMITTARTVVKLMYKNAETVFSQPQPEPASTPSKSDSTLPPPHGTPQPEDNADAENDEDTQDRETPANLTPFETNMHEMQQLLDDDLYHVIEKSGLDSQVGRDMEALEEAGCDLKEVGSGMEGPSGEPLEKINCIVFKRLTDQLLQSKSFPFVHRSYRSSSTAHDGTSVQALTDGTHMGNALAHRIQVLADETKLITTRQKKGRIDKRLLASLGFDNDQVFYESIIERKEPVVLHFSVDASGSMQGIKWQRAMTVAIALARASKQIRTLDVVLSLRSGDNHNNAAVAIIFDSRRDSFDHVRHFFPFLSTAGSTPEGLAFEAIREEILNLDPKSRKFFVNISDGAPAFSTSRNGAHFAYSGEEAYRHTARQMREFREAGINILSYFVSDYDGDAGRYGDAFRKMYGKEAEFVAVEKVTQIARTLNRMFLREAEK